MSGPRGSLKSRSLKKAPRKKRGRARRILLWLVVPVALLYGCWIAGLVYLRFLPPLTTGVQIQRRIEAWIHWSPYDRHAEWRGLSRISPHLQHAVIAAEDARFYQHHGLDFKEIEKIIEEDPGADRPTRGGSTLTQQLVKNLFFTTHRSYVRKGIEFTLSPIAEVVLGKQRVLELYLNIAEWGPGVYGAEAAAQHYYRISASRLTRDQAARLAACLPSPLRRKPSRMNGYSAQIQRRMSQMNW